MTTGNWSWLTVVVQVVKAAVTAVAVIVDERLREVAVIAEASVATLAVNVKIVQ